MKLEKRDPVKKNSADAKHRLLQSICIKGVGFEIYIEFFHHCLTFRGCLIPRGNRTGWLRSYTVVLSC